MARRRHLARIAVMQTLFEAAAHSIDPIASLQRNLGELGDVQVDDAFAASLLTGVLSCDEEIRQTIARHAPDWSLERMDPIARTVLLAGVYELMFLNDVPPAVVMNEAIEIAKEYGTDESAKFVNGVLNAVHQARRAMQSV